LLAELFADGGQAGDAIVHLGELAPQHGDGIGAHVPRVVAGAQARDEGTDVVQVEPDREQGPDLADDPQFGVAVRTVTVGRAVRPQQAVRLVVPQRPGTDAGAPRQFADQHDPTLNLVAGVNANA
jgi:hypothetical protein